MFTIALDEQNLIFFVLNFQHIIHENEILGVDKKMRLMLHFHHTLILQQTLHKKQTKTTIDQITFKNTLNLFFQHENQCPIQIFQKNSTHCMNYYDDYLN